MKLKFFFNPNKIIYINNILYIIDQILREFLQISLKCL